MTKRFNPPPGWPKPPTGWTPPPGWKPPTDLPPAPSGWQFWIDEAEASSVGAAASSRSWRPSWKLYVAAGVVALFALIGLAAGAAGVLVLGGVAMLLSGVVGLIRPRWVGAPTRIVTGIASGAGFALLVAGVAISPSGPGRSATACGNRSCHLQPDIPRAGDAASTFGHSRHTGPDPCEADADGQDARALGDTCTDGHADSEQEARRRHRASHPRRAEGEGAGPQDRLQPRPVR